MRMKYLSGVQFSAKELQDLVTVSVSCVRVERRIRHIAMLPNCLGDLKSAVNGILNSLQNRFDVSFNGFILGYKNVKIITDRATMINDDSYMHLDIEADFYIFTPEVGCTLSGIVNKKGVAHIGCLVHKCFHVAIPRPTEDTVGEWLGTSVNIGDQVTFRVEICDFTGSLPYIRGKLINVSSGCATSVGEDEGDCVSELRKQNKEGHQSSEGDQMADNVGQEKMEPVLITKVKKRKRHLENKGEIGSDKKRKKREVEDYKSGYCDTPENEDLHFTRLSSADAEYSTILETLKETYLTEAQVDFDPKVHKKKKKEKKKHKMCTDTNEGKETIAEVTEELKHKDEVVNCPDHMLSVKKMHKNKTKQKEKSIVDIPHQMTFMEVCKTSGKKVDNMNISRTALTSISSSAALPVSSFQETDLVVRDIGPKPKKKRKECDSHSVKALPIQSKVETFTSSQKSPITDRLESYSSVKDEYFKERRKKHDLHGDNLSYMQNKNVKSIGRGVPSMAFEKSAEYKLGAQTENKNETHLKTVPSTVDLLNGTESVISAPASGQNDFNSFLTPSIAASYQAGVQETDIHVKGRSTKAKKKKIKFDSHVESADVQGKIEACVSPQESPLMNNLMSNSSVMVQNPVSKKEKKKKLNSHSGGPLNVQSEPTIRDQNCKASGKTCNPQNKDLPDVQNESDKPTTKEESVVSHDALHKDESLGSITGNVDEGQVMAVPSVADLLSRVKSKLKVELPKKRRKKDDHDEAISDKSGSNLLALSHVENKRKKSEKSHPNKKQHISKKSKDKTSVSFDPAALLAEYMSKFEATGKDDTANECHSSKEDAADSTTSNTSFRSSFCLTGAGMANAVDRKRKKMNKGKGDAMPVRRSLPLLPSSNLYAEVDEPGGQDIVQNLSIESSIQSLKSSANECDVLLTHQKCFTDNDVSESPKTSISDTKQGAGSKLSISSPKQVNSPEKTPSGSVSSSKGGSNSHLPTGGSALSRKNSKEASAVNSSKTKDQTQFSSGFTHHVNVSKLPTSDKNHGVCSERESVNASLILPHHNDVLQRLKSPPVDSRTLAGIPQISPLQAKSVSEVSTDVKETVTSEIKDKHKTKKKLKDKKSKLKDDKDREHIERKQKKKNAQDHKRRKKGELEKLDRREEHKEENTGTKGKTQSKEKGTKTNLEDLKMLASKLFNSFLEQEK